MGTSGIDGNLGKLFYLKIHRASNSRLNKNGKRMELAKAKQVKT